MSNNIFYYDYGNSYHLVNVNSIFFIMIIENIT